MTRLTSIQALKNLRDELKTKIDARSEPHSSDSIIQIKVAMATCGIASGARPVYDYLREELAKRNIPAWVTKTGCMGTCYAEPTVEVTLPGSERVIFGYVDLKKADEIIERYIRKGEMLHDMIPIDYETIDSNQAGEIR